MEQLEDLPSPAIELKKLSPKHMQVAALLAQGVDRRTIALACDFTPEYVTWLQRQPLFVTYIKEMSAAVNTRLEALFSKSVDTINEAMDCGSTDEKLKAAKLQMEATGRIGRYVTPPGGGEQGDRLEQLSERLLQLLQRQRGVIHEHDEEVSEAEILGETGKGGRSGALPRLQSDAG